MGKTSLPHQPAEDQHQGPVSDPADFVAPQLVEPPFAKMDRSSNSDGKYIGALINAWSQLKDQEADFQRRHEQLETLRMKLAKHLDNKFDDLSRKQHELDDKQIKTQRQRSYLKDAKLHLRRLMKEQTEQLRELRDRQQTLQKYESLPHPDDDRWNQRLAEITHDYEAQIELLSDEKNTAQHRLEELEQQLKEWQHQRRSQTDREQAKGVLVSADWRFTSALIAGVIVSVVLSFTTAFSYEMRLQIQADPAKLSPEEINSHQLGLARMLAAVREAESTSADFSDEDISILQNPLRLCALVYATQAKQAQAYVKQAADLYIEQVNEAQRLAEANLQDNLVKLESELSELHTKHDEMIAHLADERLVVTVDSPKEELGRLHRGLTLARSAFDRIRAELESSESVLLQLQSTPVEETPVVSEAQLSDAISQDLYLSQDYEALRARLNQVRDFLMQAMTDGNGSLEAMETSVQDLSVFLDEQRLTISDVQTASQLDPLVTQIQTAAQLVNDFRKHWDQQQQNLQHNEVDPQRRHTLSTQRQIDTLIKDFHDALSRQMDEVQTEYHRFRQSLTDQAQYFQLLNGLVREIRQVVRAQANFVNASTQILPSGDFHLDALIHSVEGLTHRVKVRTLEIRNRLSIELREERRKELQEKIESQQKEIAALKLQREETIDHVLALQDELNQLLPYIETFGATQTVIRYSRQQVDTLQQQTVHTEQTIEDTKTALEDLIKKRDPLSQPELQVSNWPVNSAARLSQIGLGGVASSVLVYLLLLGANYFVSTIRTPRISSMLMTKQSVDRE